MRKKVLPYARVSCPPVSSTVRTAGTWPTVCAGAWWSGGTALGGFAGAPKSWCFIQPRPSGRISRSSAVTGRDLPVTEMEKPYKNITLSVGVGGDAHRCYRHRSVPVISFRRPRYHCRPGDRPTVTSRSSSSSVRCLPPGRWEGAGRQINTTGRRRRRSGLPSLAVSVAPTAGQSAWPRSRSLSVSASGVRVCRAASSSAAAALLFCLSLRVIFCRPCVCARGTRKFLAYFTSLLTHILHTFVSSYTHRLYGSCTTVHTHT